MTLIPASTSTGRRSYSLDARRNVSIIGAGLVGSLLGIMLSKKGYKVTVFEKRTDPRLHTLQNNRSINLALSYRGWQALESIGIAEKIKPIALPMYGRMVHSMSGQLSYQPYSTDAKAIYSISRNKLNEVLLDTLEEPLQTRVLFDHRLLDVDESKPSLQLMNETTGQLVRLRSDLIIGTDGIHSTLREKLVSRSFMQAQEEQLDQEYKQLTIPAASGGQWLLEKNALHIWPRNEFMLIALPNGDGTFTCTLFLQKMGNQTFKKLRTEADITGFFSTYFNDVADLIPDLTKQFKANPVSSLQTVHCTPWCHEDKIVLMGDAAHSIVPFYGQGMNAGFEDCLAFTHLLSSNLTTWGEVLAAFYQERKANTDAIAALSLQNFVEMRQKVADPQFLLRKSIDTHLGVNYASIWKPLYNMISFSDIPYAEALQIGRRQDEVLNRIMLLDNLENQWPKIDYTPWIYNL